MDIQHQPENERFVVLTDGHEAEMNYRREGDVLVITHTGVPSEIGGRGIAGDLVRAGFDYARAHGLRVRPACSYAVAWAQRHPDYADVLAS
ncbi:N-acetyltransferase [Lysobacter sp. TY2-98]|uniref:GNAT family N-acetyltransferase n=1 Tax=Lysobacter sp. TY2-98 TaxID=2290922 RepID=UPI000E1FCB87|nr:GNAT family N-acetyltransferase [Lysobacter sp. TY2-98]AXK72045.1 N-acetyltransferase [Lysobacter sp. TY2-98]